MICIEVRGGVVIAAYSEESTGIMVVDYDDDGDAHYLVTEPIESISKDALMFLRKN
jgi:hypothetical protein